MSDKNTPFSYRWVEFFGNKAPDFLRCAHLTTVSPVITIAPPYECGGILKEITDGGVLSPMRLTGLFWMMADSLAKDTAKAEDNRSILFNAALKYIHDNVNKPTSVEEAARAVGVSRGYLSKIFSKFIDQSPKQYITSYHINEAKALLSGTSLTVSEVAEKVGYENIFDFSRAFKKITGQSPTEFKKENSHNMK